MFKQSIYYFISVVDEGSFSAAGKKYYLSQSAISQQITKLENELGFHLFDRKSYRPCLTDEGKCYYHLCKKMMKMYEDENKKIVDMSIQKQKNITIGITGPFEKKYIPLIIKEFKKKYDVSFHVKVFSLQDCIKELQKGAIDVGFGLLNDFKHIPELVYYDIYTSHICIVTSLNHPLSERKTVTIEDIKDEPIVILSRKIGAHYYEDYMKAFELDGMNPHIVKEVDNLNEFILAIQLEEGIGFSAQEVISQNDGVHAITLENSHHHADYVVGYHCENNKDIVKKFTHEIITYFEDYKKNL